MGEIGTKNILNFFRSTPDKDIIKAWEKANEKSKNKEKGKKNEQTSS